MTLSAAPLALAVNATYNGGTSLVIATGINGIDNITNANLASPGTVTINGLQGADTITGMTIANANVGSSNNYVQTISGTGLTSGGISNYALYQSGNGITSTNAAYNANTASLSSAAVASAATANNTVTLSAAPLGISITAPYSASTTITPSSFIFTGLMGGDTIVSIKNVVVRNIDVASNTSNYVISLVIGVGTASMSNYYLNGAFNGTQSTPTTNNVTLIAPFIIDPTVPYREINIDLDVKSDDIGSGKHSDADRVSDGKTIFVLKTNPTGNNFKIVAVVNSKNFKAQIPLTDDGANIQSSSDSVKLPNYDRKLKFEGLLEDGSAMPRFIQLDPTTKLLLANKEIEDNLPLAIKVNSKDDDKTINTERINLIEFTSRSQL